MSKTLRGSHISVGEDQPRRHGWPKWVEILVTALLTGIVTIVTGMFIFQWQEREPRLVYSTADTIPFSGQNQVVAIYQLSIGNEGKKEVEDVDCFIRVPWATLEQKRISADPSIVLSDVLNGDTLKVHINGLNPSEIVQISVLAKAQNDLPARPEIGLRGKGLTGIEKTAQPNKQREFFSLVPAFAGLATGMMGLMVMMRRRQRSTDNEDQERHDEDQRRVLAYLCGLHDLTHEVARYLGGVPKTSYWVESDRLVFSAINSKDNDIIRQTKLPLEDLLVYAVIAEVSQGLVCYNLARLSLATGDKDEMQEWLSKAQSKAPKLIAARIKIDPLFKDIAS